MASTQTSGGWDGFLVNTVDGRRYFNNKTFDARAFTYSFINKTNPQRLQYSGATLNVSATNTALSAAMIKNKIAVQAAATNLNLTTLTGAGYFAAFNNSTSDLQPWDVFKAYTFSLVCTGAGSMIVTAADASVTLNGLMNVNANTSGRFRIVNTTTANNAVSIFRIG
jgi:hypothetical protein